MDQLTILLINEATVPIPYDLNQLAAALELQANRDFRPYYPGQPISIRAVAPGAQAIPENQDCWWMVLLDDSDQEGALGYHELTPAGFPVGKVFAKTDLEYGENVSITVSHEVLEQLADPFCSKIVEGPGNSYYAYEVADAVEDDSYGYQVNGITLSDFVLPAWFGETNPAGTSAKMDFQGVVKEPFILAKGGYISKCIDGNWTQISDFELATHKRHAHPHSRRGRRKTSRFSWQKSVMSPKQG